MYIQYNICTYIASGRVTLGITMLLTLGAMYGSLLSITPPISYTTKLDMWILGCFFFVWGSLFETVVVVYIKYHHLLTKVDKKWRRHCTTR